MPEDVKSVAYNPASPFLTDNTAALNVGILTDAAGVFYMDNRGATLIDQADPSGGNLLGGMYFPKAP